MAKKYTYLEVKYFVEVESDSGCKLLSTEYKNNQTKLSFKCKCGNEFEASFNSFKSNNKKQCNKCGRRNFSNKKTKTNQEFIKEVFDLVNDEYAFLEDYKGVHSKILCKHNKCGHEFYVRPNHFLRGSRCPKCRGDSPHKARKVRKAHKQFLYECHQVVGDEYCVLGGYVNASTPILLKHNECGHEYYVSPYNFLRLCRRCPICMQKQSVITRTKTNEEFLKEVYELVGDEYIFLECYVKNTFKIKVKHNFCGYEYKVAPRNFLIGNRCPQCAESKGEQSIRMHLENKNIKFQQEYSFDDLLGIRGGVLRFDFAIFDNDNLQLLIEYDGEQHYHHIEGMMDEVEFKTLQSHDNRKTQYCEDNNIPLLRIPYWDFDNIEEVLINCWDEVSD